MVSGSTTTTWPIGQLRGKERRRKQWKTTGEGYRFRIPPTSGLTIPPRNWRLLTTHPDPQRGNGVSIFHLAVETKVRGMDVARGSELELNESQMVGTKRNGRAEEVEERRDGRTMSVRKRQVREWRATEKISVFGHGLSDGEPTTVPAPFAQLFLGLYVPALSEGRINRRNSREISSRFPANRVRRSLCLISVVVRPSPTLVLAQLGYTALYYSQ